MKDRRFACPAFCRGLLFAIFISNVGQAAEPVVVAVRHEHFGKPGVGEIRMGESSISFRETGKHAEHSRAWAYDEVQRFFVGPNSIRILSYEDVKWKLGRDLEYEYHLLTEGAAQRVLEAARGRIDERRLVAAVPDLAVKPVWQAKAKLLTGWGGSDGTVFVGEDAIVYQTAVRDASRTWSFRQIRNISTAGPFDLTITTLERDFRFQLKTELDENLYNRLWRRLNHVITQGEHE